ncbi:sensor histidine kinase [Hippea alviniae]|uniref:sensor histidine kinase n=1 Tax=Hippea alviniae TaxID=1279027 RepID=UPI0003B34C73|nr:ATP-binding protein [Hippea alviniae]
MDEKFKTLQVMFEAVLNTSRKLEKSYAQLKRKFEVLEDKLERNRRYLENILKSIDSGVCSIDKNGFITVFNRKACLVFATKEGKVKGKHIGEIFAIEELVEKSACEVVEYFRSESRIELSVRGDKKILSLSASLIFDEDKEDGAVVVFSDITQVERLKEENEKKEKLAIIGQMAASIAHDIKNPLASIELLVPLLDDGSKKEIVDNIMMSIKRINNIVNNTLLFTKTVNYVPEKFSSLDFAKEVEFEVYAQIKNSEIEFEKHIEEFDMVSDRNLLKSAVVNVLANALDFAKNRVSFNVFRRDKKAVFEISDDGCGIDDVDKIFEPFYTNKKNGTGLGLAIVKQAVEILDGNLEIETEKGKGTTFRIVV